MIRHCTQTEKLEIKHDVGYCGLLHVHLDYLYHMICHMTETWLPA